MTVVNYVGFRQRREQWGAGFRNLPTDKPKNRYTTKASLFLFFTSANVTGAYQSSSETCVELAPFGMFRFTLLRSIYLHRTDNR